MCASELIPVKKQTASVKEDTTPIQNTRVA
jgi:hypothetical protein